MEFIFWYQTFALYEGVKDGKCLVEQAIREIYLKPFEISVARWCKCSYAVFALSLR